MLLQRPGFDPGLYDEVHITYSLRKPSDHHVCLYWATPAIPMSQRTYITGSTTRHGNQYKSVFKLSDHPDWIYLDSLTGLRFDMSDICVNGADTAHITEVVFSVSENSNPLK